MELNQLALDIRDWRIKKGFVTPATIRSDNAAGTVTDADLMLGKLMLVVTEVAEAAEAVRHSDEANFREELADTMIRVLDICGTMGIDNEDEIFVKMGKNAKRPERHGKKTVL